MFVAPQNLNRPSYKKGRPTAQIDYKVQKQLRNRASGQVIYGRSVNLLVVDSSVSYINENLNLLFTFRCDGYFMLSKQDWIIQCLALTRLSTILVTLPKNMFKRNRHVHVVCVHLGARALRLNWEEKFMCPFVCSFLQRPKKKARNSTKFSHSNNSYKR